MNGILVSMT